MAAKWEFGDLVTFEGDEDTLAMVLFTADRGIEWVDDHGAGISAPQGFVVYIFLLDRYEEDFNTSGCAQPERLKKWKN